jgi:hypothetical protein
LTTFTLEQPPSRRANRHTPAVLWFILTVSFLTIWVGASEMRTPISSPGKGDSTQERPRSRPQFRAGDFPSEKMRNCFDACQPVIPLSPDTARYIGCLERRSDAFFADCSAFDLDAGRSEKSGDGQQEVLTDVDLAEA